MDISKMSSRDEINPEIPRIIANIQSVEPSIRPNTKSKRVIFDSNIETKTFYADSSDEEDNLSDEIHNLSIQDKDDSMLAPDSEEGSFWFLNQILQVHLQLFVD